MRGLTEQERAIVLRDFNLGRQHVFLSLQIKLACFQTLPWLFAGMAHHNPNPRKLGLIDVVGAVHTTKMHYLHLLQQRMPEGSGGEDWIFQVSSQNDHRSFTAWSLFFLGLGRPSRTVSASRRSVAT